MTFESLKLSPPILRALREEGYAQPTPIQCQAIGPALERRDLLGCAQTGTGKTAAFALPILQTLEQTGRAARAGRAVRALVLTPTRELAIQIFESFSSYGRYLHQQACVVYGGVSQKPQTDALSRGADILVATPGRLLDLMGQGYIDLSGIETFVLDEADRMLDMGFIHDVRRVVESLPAQRQNMLFSATMPGPIEELADRMLRSPVKVAVTPPATTVEAVRQAVYLTDKAQKRALLTWLLQTGGIDSALVFTRTKHGADRVARSLAGAKIAAQSIHGDKSQGARQAALSNFKSGKIRVLVATDIAARGIDIDGLSHVINFDLPNEPEAYVHRIGRTGRAGAGGTALSFCDAGELDYLAGIEKLIRRRIAVEQENPFPMTVFEPPAAAPQTRGRAAGSRAHSAAEGNPSRRYGRGKPHSRR